MAVNAVDPDFDQLESMITAGIQPPTAMAPAEVTDPGGENGAPPEPEPPTEPAPAEPAEPAVAAEPGDAAAAPATPAEPAAGEPGHKEPGWVDKRLSSLAAKRREAEQDARIARQEAADAKARAERVEREFEAFKAGKPAETAPAGQPAAARPAATQAPAAGAVYEKPKPVLKDFTQAGGKAFTEGEDYDDAAQRHAEALLDWREDKRAFEDAVATVEVSRKTQEQAFLKDIQSAMETHPEFEDARDFVLSKTTDGLQVAISNLPRFSDEKAAWPEVVMHLADNPDVLQSLEQLYSDNPHAATARLGQIMAQIGTPATPGRAPAAAAPAAPAAAPAARRAPTPPRTVGGNAAPAPVNLEDDMPFDRFAIELGKHMK